LRRVKVTVLTADEVQTIRDYLAVQLAVVRWRSTRHGEELTIRLKPLRDGRTQVTVW
jgi:hypothetical protein